MSLVDAAAAIAGDGWALVRGALDATTVSAASAALDEVFAAEDDIAGTREWLTDAYRVAYMLPAKHPDLLAAATHPALIGLARAVLGDDCVLGGSNGIDMLPGGPGQPLHADHPVPTPGHTLYVHMVCPLDPFTAERGATRVVTGSHLRSPDERTPPADDAAIVEVIEALPGDVIAYDATLWHGGGANRTDLHRRALHVLWVRPWVQPHWDVAASLPPEVAATLDDDQRRLLGFTSRPRRFDLSARRATRALP